MEGEQEQQEEQEMWWRKLGFYINPFTIKPAPFDNKVFGQDQILEDLYYKLPAGTMSFVEGKLGTGKTTILKSLIAKFRGRGKVIYFSCNRLDTELNIEELLKGRYGFWGKLFGMMPKEMIVLLQPIMEGRADLVLGSRLLYGKAHAMLPHQAFGNRLTAFLIREI